VVARTRPLLIAALLLPLVSVLAQEPSKPAYMPPGTPEVGGIHHLVLIYHGTKRRVPWTKEALLPYVAYLDKKGQPQDWFFDSFLFIEFAADDGAYIHHYVKGKRLPTIDDWNWLADCWFRPTTGLIGLEQAVEEVAQKLRHPDKKVKVVITMPKPFREDAAFGPLPGTTEKLDLAKAENQQKVLQWYIQRVLKQWQERAYKHLELAGFYWTNESIAGEDTQLATWTSDYLHRLKLRHYWIPYFGARGIGKWREAGFDGVMLQPNYFFRKKPLALSRFQSAAKIARMFGTGIEIEFDRRSLTDEEFRDRMIAYLDAGVYYGWMKDALLGYYEGGGAIKLFYENPETGHDLYQKLYQWVKGAYRPSGKFDFTKLPLVSRDNSQNLALASKGAKVIGAAARPEWSDEIGPEKIIDGNIDYYGGMCGFGAFPIPGSFTIELPKVTVVARTQTMLYDLDGRFFRYRIDTSRDGQTWEPAVNKDTGEWVGWQVEKFIPRQAKYVRFTCLHSSANKICQVVEFEVYSDSQ